MNEPPKYAPYHRPGDGVPDPAKLRALADGYFGLSWVFLVNVLLVLPLNALMMGDPMSEEAAVAKGMQTLIWIGVIFVVITLLSYRCNKRIAEGMDWSPAAGIAASILMGINSALCCGVVGYAIMQSIASNKMRNVYRMKLGMFAGKKMVNARIAELEAQRAAGPAAPTFTL